MDMNDLGLHQVGNVGSSGGDAEAGDILSGKTASVDSGRVTGTLALTGDAIAANVLSGKKFYKDNAKSQLTGTMTNRGAQVLIPAVSGASIYLGYHGGSGGVPSEANFVAGNVKAGVDLWNLTGTLVVPKILLIGNTNIVPFTTTLNGADVQVQLGGLYRKYTRSSSSSDIVVCTTSVIDLTNYTKLIYNAFNESGTSSSTIIGVAAANTHSITTSDYVAYQTGFRTVSQGYIDISACNGEYYIKMCASSVNYTSPRYLAFLGLE